MLKLQSAWDHTVNTTFFIQLYKLGFIFLTCFYILNVSVLITTFCLHLWPKQQCKSTKRL